MERGRPVGSEVRQNIIEILFLIKKGYGYEIYSIYRQVFPKVTMRLIYYHLKKGVELGELKVHEIKRENGEYSWGNSAEKVYYSLGNNSKPLLNEKVKKYLELRIQNDT